MAVLSVTPLCWEQKVNPPFRLYCAKRFHYLGAFGPKHTSGWFLPLGVGMESNEMRVRARLEASRQQVCHFAAGESACT